MRKSVTPLAPNEKANQVLVVLVFLLVCLIFNEKKILEIFQSSGLNQLGGEIA